MATRTTSSSESSLTGVTDSSTSGTAPENDSATSTPSTSPTTTEASSGKTVATYKPGLGIPGVTRVITKKDAKTMEVDLDEDLVWERGNQHRVDVTNVPEALLAVLKRDRDFKISSE